MAIDIKYEMIWNKWDGFDQRADVQSTNIKLDMTKNGKANKQLCFWNVARGNSRWACDEKKEMPLKLLPQRKMPLLVGEKKNDIQYNQVFISGMSEGHRQLNLIFTEVDWQQYWHNS